MTMLPLVFKVRCVMVQSNESSSSSSSSSERTSVLVAALHRCFDRVLNENFQIKSKSRFNYLVPLLLILNYHLRLLFSNVSDRLHTIVH